MSNAIFVYDFTIPSDKVSKDELIKMIELISKKWCFQLEQGESSYEHYQGRLSLIKKSRIGTLINNWPIKETHWSPTSLSSFQNDFYVMKEDTRIDGPWRNNDKMTYIPRQIREINELYDWQKQLIQMTETFDTRSIYYIYDPHGNQGKSIFSSYIRAYGLGFKVPPINDMKELMGVIIDNAHKKRYVIDMPRALSKDKLYQFYSAIEEIKNGYAYDTRYKYREVMFDSPAVIIFSNKLPDTTLLSLDRWKIYELNNGTLNLLT